MAGEETLLLSGKIKVVKSYYSALDHDPYFLKDGDMVMMNKDIDLMEKETFDTKDLKAWMDDRMIFKNASLNELISRLKSWFNIEIVVLGNSRPGLTYTGTFPHPDLQTVLLTIGKSWGFRYLARQNTVTLYF